MSRRRPDLWRHVSFASLALRDALGVRPSRNSDDEHLRATMAWLCRAHDVCGGRGVSSGYSWLIGWQEPYPETTGYIIPTFLDCAELTGQPEFVDRARRMAGWEIEIQRPDGGVRGGIGVNDYPI
ncbi:MAG: hypothetical protein HY718_19525, partial [Planctomycetes bacterium]|nr:hypothetical protein [Planctomycetota bacterium]